MTRCSLSEEELIDYYCGEIKNLNIKEHIDYCSMCQEYLASLKAVEVEMERVEEVFNPDFSVQDKVNLNNIFAEVEDLEKKGAIKETILFGGLAFTLLFIVISLFIAWDIKYLIYVQLVLYAIMPFILLPLLKNKKVEGVS